MGENQIAPSWKVGAPADIYSLSVNNALHNFT